MATHTRGPWRLYEVWSDWPDNPGPIVDKDDRHIFRACLVGPYGDASLDWLNENDKALIAEAPTMYELLERCAGWRDSGEPIIQLEQEIRALIQRINAKGE